MYADRFERSIMAEKSYTSRLLFFPAWLADDRLAAKLWRLDMNSAKISLGKLKEHAESLSSRKVPMLGQTTDSIAKELNECLCGIVINVSTCLRMLSANPPNVEGARETSQRTIRCSNRAAEAVSRLKALQTEEK